MAGAPVTMFEAIVGLLFSGCTLLYLIYRLSKRVRGSLRLQSVKDLGIRLHKDNFSSINDGPNAIQTVKSNASFWIDRTAPGFRILLQQTQCPQKIQDWCYAFYTRTLVSHLGPSPQRFTHITKCTNARPYSYVSDDHTPIELNWVIDGDGSSTMQFAMEMVASDGRPVDLEDCARFVEGMKEMEGQGVRRGFNTAWNKICRETIGTSKRVREKADQGDSVTHFFFGGKFTPEGVMLKESYVPGTRALLEGCSSDYLVTNCMRRLGITSWDRKVVPYLDSLPLHAHRPTPDMVSIDCVEPSKNRIKVYFRCYDKTFRGVLDRLTLGGRLNDEGIQNLVPALQELWELLFPGIGIDDQLPVKDASRPSWLGFLVYYEMKLGTDEITPKVYIPVRQYCANDMEVVNVLERYLNMKGLDIARTYGDVTKRIFAHRNLSSSTGIHYYVGLCWRPAGPQISMYLSPEAFTYPEYH